MLRAVVFLAAIATVVAAQPVGFGENATSGGEARWKGAAMAGPAWSRLRYLLSADDEDGVRISRQEPLYVEEPTWVLLDRREPPAAEPFWVARGRRRQMSSSSASSEEPFWAARGRRRDDPFFWPARGKRTPFAQDEVPGEQKGVEWWASRGRRASLRDYLASLPAGSSAFQAARGKRTAERALWVAEVGRRRSGPTTSSEEPFWAARGRRAQGSASAEEPFWAARGRSVNAVQPSFWPARGKRTTNQQVVRGSSEESDNTEDRSFWEELDQRRQQQQQQQQHARGVDDE